MLQSWDLKIVQGENLFAAHNQFAGDDKARARDLQVALDIPEVKAIFCARGGYGAGRILPLLDWKGFLKDPKWIIGLSDITYLHGHINSNLGVETIHGPMPAMFQSSSWNSAKCLKSAVFGELQETTFDGHKLNRTGTRSGELVGGNLSILYALSGTSYFPTTHGRILFIEDLDEYLYHIDRMMLNLKLSGHLENLEGLIVGGLTEMNDNAIPFGKTAQEIVLEYADEFAFPVCFDFPAGHVEENMSMYFGREITLTVGEKCHITY